MFTHKYEVKAVAGADARVRECDTWAEVSAYLQTMLTVGYTVTVRIIAREV